MARLVRTAILHLVRKANGVAPFHEFVRSFRAALPTGDWRLVLIFKGFDGGDTQPFVDAIADLPYETVSVPDEGFDIATYFKAAEHVEADVLVIFNSFSVIRDPRWYELYCANFGENVGAIGATGSLESVVRNHLIYAKEASGLVESAKKLAIAAGLVPWFPPFPNAHLRTNALMIRRADFLRTHRFPVNTRFASLFYESGWLSLTRQLRAQGLEVLVVNRDGVALPPERWADAQTFRSGDQGKALVEDNRTREYADAPEDRKRQLRWLSFGAR